MLVLSCENGHRVNPIIERDRETSPSVAGAEGSILARGGLTFLVHAENDQQQEIVHERSTEEESFFPLLTSSRPVKASTAGFTCI